MSNYDRCNGACTYCYCIMFVVVLIIGIIVTVGAMHMAEMGEKSVKYEEACILASSSTESDLIAAYNTFASLGDYKDSQRYLPKLESRISSGIYNWYTKGDVQWCKDCGAIMDSDGNIILPTMMYRKDN